MKSSPIAEARRFVVALALVVAVCGEARAAGLYLAPRGVRPLARGGAFVAGADDVHALTYNPAGLAYAPRQILVDVAMSFYGTDYTRRVTPESEPLAEVHGESLQTPLPTIGFVHDFGLLPNLTFGASVGADTPTLQNWPSKLEDGSPAPQRYAIEEYAGTALVKIAAGAAYRPMPELAIGLSLQALVGTFADTKTVSACDGVICTQAEDSAHDTQIQLVMHNIIAPGLHVGVIYEPVPWLRLGAAWESTYTVNGTADLNVRLPSAAEYDDAAISPADAKATVKFTLPWSARFGIEARNDLVRVEVAAVHDHWSTFDTVSIRPHDVSITNVLAVGDYQLADMSIEPRFKSIWSFRLGTEWTPEIAGTRDLTLRLGGFIEPSAIPDERLSAEWVDLNKTFVTGGVGYRFGKVLLDATTAVGFFQDRSIRNSAVQQVNPLRPAFSGTTFIGNGDYSASAVIIGLSMRYLFE